MKKNKIKLLALVIIASFQGQVYAQNSYFFPKANQAEFDKSVPTPEQFLGYAIGTHYTRHDQIIAYFKALEKATGKVKLQTIGRTYEHRDQVILTVTSTENHGRLEQIRQEHLSLTEPTKPAVAENAPVVVLLGYSVHGAETSSGEAALLTAYYLAANTSEETQKFLKESVVLIDPALNPDGRDRAAGWHNGFKSITTVADPSDLEHNHAWPGGRTNHYLTDLNRDWLSAEQIESQNRLDFFHKWYPNVQIDFHEMGTNSTYYFEPTPPGNESLLLPQSSYDFNATLAKYHVQALDEIGSLYFTKEAFDNLAPVYGSTYPDYFGAVGVTFEQGSSRGIAQESKNGLVSFDFTIRNQVTSGIATVRGAVAEKKGLFKLQKDFFTSAVTQGKTSGTSAFVFGDAKDKTLTKKLLNLVLKHRLQVFELSSNITVEGKTFEKGNAYLVPTDQPFYRIVSSVFDETTKFKDTTTFYSTTAWSIAHAYGLKYAKINTPVTAKGNQVSTITDIKYGVNGGKTNYAYLLPWSEYNAPRALNYLLEKGLIVKASAKAFTLNTNNGKETFSYGSLVIPVASQKFPADSVYSFINQAAQLAEVTFSSASTGFSVNGIDLGSNNITAITQPKVAIISGPGTNVGEVGQVWFLLDQHLNIPATKLDAASLDRTSLERYNTIVLTSAQGGGISKAATDNLKDWVSKGNTLITFGSSSAWAIQNGLVKEQVFVDSSAARNRGPVKRKNYEDRGLGGRGGSGILLADIDITNPIGYGLTSRQLFVNKIGNTILNPSKNEFATVAQFTGKPHISGFISYEIVNNLSNKAAILIGQHGQGSVVLFAEDPTYRHHWHGTDRLFTNAIFFGDRLRTQGRFGMQAE